MAAGLGFKTFNTGDVLSAADVNGYLMQGILVFASATARDAAITSPEEGQFAFLKDTNVTTYYTGSAWANVDTTGMTNPMTTTGDVIYSSSGSTPARLGIGTAGQILKVNSGATAPEWATATSSAPNYTLINTGGTALTGAATITISGISGKNQLFVTIIGCSSATGNSNFYIRLNSDSANYGYFNAIMIAPDSVTEDSSASTSLMYIGAISANAGSVLSGYCWVDGCNSSGVKVMHHSTGSTNAGGGNAQLNTGGGTWSDSATVSSISIISSAGNFDAGTIYVYGA